jgi:hypothetical protein
MPPSVPLDQMQPALLDSLSTIRRKAKALSVLFGLGVLLAAAVGLILGTVFLDYLLNLPAVPRLFFVLLCAFGIGYTLWHWVVTPVAARLSLEDVAGRLEGAFPQFDDRLRSTVNFIGADIPGSSVMKQRVVSEANRVAAAVDLDSALLAKPVVYSMGAGIGALVLAILLGLVYSDFARIAMSRLLMVNAQQWPRRAQIDLVNALPTKVASGQRFDLRMRLSKGDKPGIKARVYYQYDNGSVQQQIMNRNDDGSYSVSLEARGTAMNVWMKADDDQTDPKKIDVVQRLAINRVDAVIAPPPYAKTPPTNINLSEAPATMTYGSRVELRIGFNKPLAQDKPIALEPIKADAKLPAIAWIHPTPMVAVGTFVATESMRFRVHATDTDYFDNAGLEEFDLIVKPDQMPSVIIENPRRNEDRTAVAVVNLEALAEDDFDISSMTLVVDRVGDKKHWEISLANWFKVESGADRRRFRVKHEWELQQLASADLKPGDVLDYYVKVTDNYNLNGAVHPPVSSGKLKINIISQEALSIQVTEALRAMAEKVKQAQNTQNRTKQETHNLKQDTEKKPQMDGGDKAALNRLNDQESTLASQTKQLAGQVADIEKRLEENRSDNQGLKDISKDVKTTLNETAENPMTEASRKLAQASDKADPKSARNEKGQIDPAKAQKAAQDRNDALEKSEAKQQEASDQLGKALEKMGNLGTFEQMLQRVRDALAQQQNLSKQLSQIGRETLGKKPEELTAAEKKKLDDLAAEQKKAAEKTDKLTQDMNKAAQQTSKSDPASSKAMEQAAQQSQQQQVASNQSQAAQQAQQNQQAQAQSKQKQAELGLQMMLDTLREAERRKLEQLAKDLAKLQELIANLIRRQAGHNIDNLFIQGTAATLKQISDDLLAKAERLRDKMPLKPEVPALGNFQITTEKNTRDVSKTAEDLPKGGADIAATLTKAAGLMERAIVSLKETKLPEAYDPSQVKALAALEDAKAKTDAALAEIQKQMEEADKESIRQAYVKIKTEQEKINLETSRIDGSPRLPDGTYKREDAVNLGKLPGQQGTLADRTQKLEEDLVALGGIVYVWANKDIVESMNDVKSDLGKPTTGVPTQSEEKRIVEQLDAMIRNLAIKPKKNDFNQPPGGGNGSGAAKPRLPSEAELRLLKELQVAVNKSTKTIDAQPKPDKAKLLGLGNRQGEMRNLLDQLMQKASQGQIKLDPEPNPKDRLPEEADTAKIENQELDEWLRGSKSSDDQLTDDVKLVGQRMARSRQRLALDADPGKTTQAIQDRILTNMDNLIQLARQQQAQASAKPGKGQPGQGQKPQPNPGVKADNQGKANQSQPNRAASPANAEGRNGTDDTSASSKDIREKASEWGGLTPREREAVIEGTSEHTITKYKKLTDDYYEVMGKKGTQER